MVTSKASIHTIIKIIAFQLIIKVWCVPCETLGEKMFSLICLSFLSVNISFYQSLNFVLCNRICKHKITKSEKLQIYPTGFFFFFFNILVLGSSFAKQEMHKSLHYFVASPVVWLSQYSF